MSTYGYLQQWNSPEELKLSAHEVQVWQAPLKASSSLIQNLRQLLSEDEIVRASGFVFERVRNHFSVAHAVLRTILGLYLCEDPH